MSALHEAGNGLARWRLLSSALCCVAFCAAACDTGFTLTGTVKTHSGKPMPAEVRVVCGETKPFAHALTGPDGSFAYHGGAACSSRCKIEVRTHGRTASSAPVMHYCVARSAEREAGCRAVRLDAKLPD